MNTPADLAYPGHLPDDLKVLLTEQRVPPDDPLVALLAWHWKRIGQTQDLIQESHLTLKAVLDARIEKITGTVKALEEISQHLQGLSRLLSEKPTAFGERLDAELRQHVAETVTATQGIAQALTDLFRDTQGSIRSLHRGRIAAAFISGLSTGAVLLPWTLSHWFTRS